jgi:cell division protein FtsB
MIVNVKLVSTILFLSLLLSLACLLFFGQRGFSHLLTLQDQFATLEIENQRIAQANALLKKEVELLSENLAYIEDIARKQFGLVKKDELVYQLQPNENSEFGSDRR